MIAINKIESEIPGKVLFFSQLDSTSLYLKRVIEKKFETPFLVIAGEQTSGQGRVGKSFYSPPKSGLYFTFCFHKNQISTEDITPRAALAVKLAIDSFASCDCKIKWVNDVYLHSGKVAGILCQAVQEYILIGVGINITPPDDLPEELKNRFSSIFTEKNDIDSSDLVIAVYQFLLKVFSFSKSELFQQYKNSIFHWNFPVNITYDQKEISGICVDLNPDFSLVIKTEEGLRLFSSGILTLLS